MPHPQKPKIPLAGFGFWSKTEGCPDIQTSKPIQIKRNAVLQKCTRKDSQCLHTSNVINPTAPRPTIPGLPPKDPSEALQQKAKRNDSRSATKYHFISIRMALAAFKSFNDRTNDRSAQRRKRLVSAPSAIIKRAPELLFLGSDVGKKRGGGHGAVWYLLQTYHLLINIALFHYPLSPPPTLPPPPSDPGGTRNH